MKFLLIGCNGKMGKSITEIAKTYNDIIVCGIDKTDENTGIKKYKTTDNILEQFDAIIDFSTTENHKEFINLAIKRNIPYGLFSTILNQETRKMLNYASKNIPILFCKNASVGINLLYQMLEYIASNIPKCDCLIQEYHHKEKLDKPSGTALNIEKILSNHNIKSETFSYRVGKEKGTHIVQFFLQDETITLTHTAHSRDVFAHGAILAMHKLKEKENGLYFNL